MSTAQKKIFKEGHVLLEPGCGSVQKAVHNVIIIKFSSIKMDEDTDLSMITATQHVSAAASKISANFRAVNRSVIKSKTFSV